VIPLAVGVALVPPLLVAVTIALYGVNIPLFDQWSFAPEVLLFLFGSYDPRSLWEPFGQHRIPVPKAVMLMLARATRWDVRAEMWFDFAAELASFALLADLARRTLAPLAPAGWIWSLPWISAALFSLAAWHSWTWGWMMNAYLAVLGAALAAWACGLYAESGRGVMWMIAGAALAATSYLSGVLLLVLAPLAIVLAGEGRARWRHAAAAALASAALLGFYVAGYPTTSVARTVHVSELEPGEMTLFAVRNVGVPLGVGEPRAALAWGTAALALVALGSVPILLGARWRRALVPWLLLASFALGNGFATASGRMQAGPHAAVLSRYVPLPSLLWASLPAFAIVGATASRLARGPPSARVLASCALAIILLLAGRSYVAQGFAGLAATEARSASLVEALRCVRDYHQATEHCLQRVKRRQPGVIRFLLPRLERRRIGPFAGAEPASLGFARRDTRIGGWREIRGGRRSSPSAIRT
jgi:hypothetical protein